MNKNKISIATTTQTQLFMLVFLCLPQLTMSSSQEDTSYPKPRARTKVTSPEIQSVFSSSTKMSENSGTFIKLINKKPTLLPVKKQIAGVQKKPQLDMTSDDISEITNSENPESKSDVHSYRDKLKNRFQKMKQQSGKSLSKHKIARTFRSHANNIITLNRSIDLMKRENVAIESQMRSYTRCDSKESSEDMVSRSERYQFFCEALPDSWVLDRFPAEQTLDEINKSTQELVKSDDEDLSIVQCRNAECKSDEIDNMEKENFWVPAGKQLTIEEKVTGNPRQFEEEGLYVSEKIKLSSRQLNKLERRLLSDDKGWFDASGQLILYENPYCKTAYRPDEYSTPSKLELEYQSPKVGASHLASLSSVYIPHDDILEINVHNLTFRHHPLFSVEHVLQEKLIEFYDIYREFTACNKLERLRKKLDGLRKTVVNLKGSGDGENLTAQSYRGQITKIRSELFEESKSFRENIKNVLNSWRCIKKVRAANTFSNTSIKLGIRKEHCDDGQEYKIFFNETLNELLDEHEEEFRLKMVDYKKSIAVWKENPEDHPKPKKPRKDVDTDDVRSKLKIDVKQCFKAPGEPILHFSISHDHEISKVTDDRDEMRRRSVVHSTKIFLKFFCNNIEVCKSKMKQISDNFVCHFEEYFSLKLTDVPENVLMELYEHTGTLLNRKVAEVKLKIPLKNILIGQKKVVEEEFVKNEVVRFKHSGVGSGVNLESILNSYNISQFIDEGTLYTCGFLTCNIAWDSKQFDVGVDARNDLSEDVLDNSGCIDVDKLHRWIEKAQPDPQDPKYSVIFDFLNESTEKPEGSNGNKKYFRCDPYLYPFEIFSQADIENNIRFKLLELRDKNVPEFVGMTVPNRLKEIPTNVFSTYERRIAEENNEEYLQDDEYEYEINSHRSQGRKCLRQIHTKIFQLCRNSENNLTFEDVVNEKTVPYIQLYISNLLYNFLNWFRIRPTLSKPLPTVKFQTESSNVVEIGSPSKITVSLKSGLNIPLRCEKPRRKVSRSQSTEDAPNQSEVKAFVEVCYEQFISFSSGSAGRSPSWNDEIQFPLEVNNVDYLNPNVLNGSLVINLYDDLSTEDSNADEFKDSHFLGSVQVPVSAIAESQKLEGLFLVKTPTTLLGYEKCNETRQSASSRITYVPLSYADYAYLNMKISIEPNIPKLSPDMQSLPSSEPPYLKDYILEWNVKFNVEHSHRKFSALAIDSNGKTVCVTRYIKSLEPPQINADGFDVTPDQCARYVALIPFTENNKFYQNIWLSTEQMLKLGIGSVIDHAVALTCYFLTLNIEAWLLLGFGLPHGSMAFVLVREYTSETTDPLHYVYDITTGFKYNATDPFCPLKKIYCVINDNNLWGNVQRGDDVATSRFDFSRRFDWLPLFTRQVTSPSNSIQQKLIYVSTFDTQKIQSSVEKKLRKKIDKLRKHDRTVWNHYLCNVLKNSMSKFEINAMHGKTYTEIPEIEEMSKGFKITGCLINAPFCSVGGIVEQIINMKLHQAYGGAEFAISVYVHAYPNQVLAVWVALLRIHRKC